MNHMLQCGALLLVLAGCCAQPPQTACERAEAHLKGCQHCGGTEPGPDGFPTMCEEGFGLLRQCIQEQPKVFRRFVADTSAVQADDEEETPPDVPDEPDLPPIPPPPHDDDSEPDITVPE